MRKTPSFENMLLIDLWDNFLGYPDINIPEKSTMVMPKIEDAFTIRLIDLTPFVRNLINRRSNAIRHIRLIPLEIPLGPKW
jgi:hypothetical protein